MPFGATASSLRPGKRAQTRQKICSAAREVFSEQGLSGATMEQIALAAGTRRSTLYNHFRDKDQILAAIAEEFGHGLVDTINQLPAGRPSRAEIDLWMREAVRFTARHRTPTILLTQLGSSIDAPQVVHELGARLMLAFAERLAAFRKAVAPGAQKPLYRARATAVLRQIGAACSAYILDDDRRAAEATIAVAAEMLDRFIADHGD